MAYTPPAHNAVDFVLSPGYTAPTHTLVNFDLGENLPASMVEGHDRVVAVATHYMSLSAAIQESFDLVASIATAIPANKIILVESSDIVVAYASVPFPSNVTYQRPNAGNEGYPIPKPTSLLSRSMDDGRLAKAWWRYINSFSETPQPESALTLVKSPLVYKAARNGTLLVSGGSVSSIKFNSRNSTAKLVLSMTQGMIPVSIGDVVTIAYGGTPLVVFFPR